MNTTRLAAAASFLLACSAGHGSSGVSTREVTWSAAEAFEQGQGSTTVQHDFISKGVVLRDSTLVEDDGPGAGGYAPWVAPEDQSPTIRVDGVTQVKKILDVERPEASAAWLYARSGKAIVLFNGHAVDTTRSDKFFQVPVAIIRPGGNEVILRGNPVAPTTLKIAARQHILENAPTRADRPARSFQSTDGERWEPMDGELTVRLHLTQYSSEGSFVSPVLDLAQSPDDLLGWGKVEVQSVGITAQSDTPAGTAIEFAVRFGAMPAYDQDSWSDWQPVNAVSSTDDRYVQWRATLKSDDARKTPLLKTVTLTATLVRPPAPDWAAGLSAKEFLNPEIRYTSMPFEYENPNHPKLKSLRERYRLDDVVKHGKSELEKLVLLRNWVAHQWRYAAPTGRYPAWDADEILARQEGTCVQYAITYLQTCLALGYQARYVCGYHPGTMRTAHEVTEVWSNEYSQWVVMDPTESRNEFYADPRTGRPLSMLESRERMVKHYYGNQPATFANRPLRGSVSEEIVTVRGTNTVPAKTGGRTRPSNAWPSWTKWLMIRHVPRNNFYEKPVPLPRLQGWNQWDWTGFWSWHDEQSPRDWRYRENTSRRSDIEWTLNQVRFGAAYGEKPRSLAIKLATVTPYLDTFMVSKDRGAWKPCGREFVWELHSGANRLEMRVRNQAGVTGPVSFLVVDCKELENEDRGKN